MLNRSAQNAPTTALIAIELLAIRRSNGFVAPIIPNAKPPGYAAPQIQCVVSRAFIVPARAAILCPSPLKPAHLPD